MTLNSQSPFTGQSSLTAWVKPIITVGMGTAIAFGSLLILSPAAAAFPMRIALSLNRLQGESYDAYLRRAEVFAGLGIQRTFLSDPLTSEVKITVINEGFGIAMPIMDVQVTRSQWRQNPDPQDWASYYDGAPTSLDLLEK